MEFVRNPPSWWKVQWEGGLRLPARARVNVVYDKRRRTFVAHFRQGLRIWPKRSIAIDLPLCFGTKVEDAQHPWDTKLRGHCATGIKNLYDTLLREIPDLGAALCAGSLS